MRKRAQGEVEDTIARLKALIARKNEDTDSNLDLSDVESSSNDHLDDPGFRRENEWGETYSIKSDRFTSANRFPPRIIGARTSLYAIYMCNLLEGENFSS
jgi:hypothetical protein